jgi:hypothetical protein
VYGLGGKVAKPKQAASASAYGYKQPLQNNELLAVSKPPPKHKQNTLRSRLPKGKQK